jgi:hypothetical protein
LIVIHSYYSRPALVVETGGVVVDGTGDTEGDTGFFFKTANARTVSITAFLAVTSVWCVFFKSSLNWETVEPTVVRSVAVVVIGIMYVFAA